MPRKKPPESQMPPSVTEEYYEHCLTQMPAGAIKADLSKHAPHNSQSPPMWYVDEQKKCEGCGQEFTFTARQQQHWFEVLKIPIQVTANRCAACRKKRRGKIAAQKQHMEDVAKRPRHPNEAFFRKKTRDWKVP
jgi:hypothetical protein